MKKTILHSFVGALIFSLTCFLILYAVKARISTNPGLNDTSPNSLYVTNNETLTAAKRNTLVDTANLQNCIIYSGGSNVPATTRTLKTLSCPSDYPHLIHGGCYWSRGSEDAVRSYPSDNNTWTCKIRANTDRTINHIVRLKCCK